jgi:hypothetical protein
MIVCDVFRVGTVGLMAIPGIPFALLCVLLFCTVLTGVPLTSARTALMPDVLPGDKFVLGSAVGNITFQASQILGFVAGAAVVAILDPHKTLGIDAAAFGVSALIVLIGVRARPAPERDGSGRSSLWSVSADGIRIVFGSRMLLTLLLFGWPVAHTSWRLRLSCRPCFLPPEPARLGSPSQACTPFKGSASWPEE